MFIREQSVPCQLPWSAERVGPALVLATPEFSLRLLRYQRGCLVSPVNMAQYCFNLLKCIHKSNQIMAISLHANKFAIPPEARGNRPPVLPSLHITHQPTPYTLHAPYTPIHILHVSPKKAPPSQSLILDNILTHNKMFINNNP